MKYFWSIRETIPEGKGYGQFSYKHFIWLAVSTLFIFSMVIVYAHLNPLEKIILKRMISATLVFIEIMKMIVIKRSKVSLFEYLPVEICSFAGYAIILDSIWPGNQFFGEIMIVLFLPAAIMAIIYPTSIVLPVFNFFTIHQFLYHDLIIAYVFSRFLCKELLLTFKGLWISIFSILVLVFIIYIIDCLFDKNFMFLKDSYGNVALGMIEEHTGRGVPYTVGLICFAIFIIHVFLSSLN